MINFIPMNSSQVSVFLPSRKAISLGKERLPTVQLQPITSSLLHQPNMVSPYTVTTKFNIRKKYHTQSRKNTMQRKKLRQIVGGGCIHADNGDEATKGEEFQAIQRVNINEAAIYEQKPNKPSPYVEGRKTAEATQSPEQRLKNRNNHLRTIYGIKNSSRKRNSNSPEVQFEQVSSPISSDNCLNRYRRWLTTVQRQQIDRIQTVYYLGKRRPQLINFKYDFDDQQGDLKVYAHDQINYRYQILTIIGKGSFGQVFKAYDHKLKQHVALKVIKNKPKYTAQAKIQTQLLQFIKHNDVDKQSNIIEIKESFLFRQHVCLTFELLHQNLYQFIKQNKFSGFSLDLIRRFSIQILKSLLFLNKYNIIHCDLKPENILLRQENKSGIKVIDMGSSCKSNEIMYTYIQSRFYRAPEIILGIDYTMAIDMWSFGCILCQLFTGQPIFPGQDENQQMGMFVEMLGLPPRSFVDRAKRRKFFDDGGQLKQQAGKQYKAGIKSVKGTLVCKDRLFVQLIQRCLQWDPSKRIKPQEALLDKWILQSLPTDIRTQHLQFMKKQGHYK